MRKGLHEEPNFDIAKQVIFHRCKGDRPKKIWQIVSNMFSGIDTESVLYRTVWQSTRPLQGTRSWRSLGPSGQLAHQRRTFCGYQTRSRLVESELNQPFGRNGREGGYGIDLLILTCRARR